MIKVIALAVLSIVTISVALADAPAVPQAKKPGVVSGAYNNFKNGVKAIPDKFRAGTKSIHDRFAKKPAPVVAKPAAK